MLEQLISNSLPQSNVSLIFGYGSQIVKQHNNDNSNNLIDIILAVDDSLSWHQENLKVNSQHYSFLRFLPNCSERITRFQEQLGAKVYFNPYVRLGNFSIKYGIVKSEHLIEDLLQWNFLYIAGRLHKPIDIIMDRLDSNEKLKNAIKFNKESAVRAALLQLPETFTRVQLYRTITGLSYRGDIRMLFGEDVNKIDNIVSAQMERFDSMYLPLIKVHSSLKDSVNWNETKQVFTQDLSSKNILRLLGLLPLEVRKSICLIHQKQARTLELETVLASASKSIYCDKLVSQALMSIVRRSSLTQSIKGLITAGLVKSFKYSQRKLTKSLLSRLKFA